MSSTRYQLLLFIGIISLSLLCPSCLYDRTTPSCTTPELVVSVRLRPLGDESLRAIGSPSMGIEPGKDSRNENVIKNYSFLIFNQDGTLNHFVPSMKVTPLADHKYLIKLPVRHASQYNGNQSYTIVMVANCSETVYASVQRLSDLSTIVLAADFMPNKKEDAFVMMGQVQAPINLSGTIRRYDAGTIDLTRLAAKLRLRYPVIPGGAITAPDGSHYHIVEDATRKVGVMLLNTRNKGVLKPSLPYEPANFNDYNSSLYSYTNSVPFGTSKEPHIQYTYPAQWGNLSNYTADTDPGTNPVPLTVLYVVPLQKEGTTRVENYYYSMSILGASQAGGAGDRMIHSNYIYDFTPIIEVLGSTEDAPIEVTGSYSIKPWLVDNLDYIIPDMHYFVAKEHHVIMPNLTNYSVSFAATRTVSVRSIGEVWYEEYTPYDHSTQTGGVRVKRVIQSGDPRYPRFTVDNHNKVIHVSSSLPANFSPKYFTVILEDQGGLTDQITYVQYPPQYITGVESKVKDLYPGVYYSSQTVSTGQTNFNIFRITSLSPSVYKIGDPTYVDDDGIIRTKEDEESNQLMSPDFVIASQRGIYERYVLFDRRRYKSQYGYSSDDEYYYSAKERCALYGEGGYPPGTWRLPTVTELKFIDRIQDSPNSSVKKLLEGEQYWSARRYAYYNFYTNSADLGAGDDSGVVLYSDSDIKQIRKSDYGYNGYYYYNEYGYNYYVESDSNHDYMYIFPTSQMAGVRCVHDVY